MQGLDYLGCTVARQASNHTSDCLDGGCSTMDFLQLLSCLISLALEID